MMKTSLINVNKMIHVRFHDNRQAAKISKKSAGPACKRTGPAKLIYKYEA